MGTTPRDVAKAVWRVGLRRVTPRSRWGQVVFWVFFTLFVGLSVGVLLGLGKHGSFPDAFESIAYDTPERLAEYLAAGRMDPNECTYRGYTLLHAAAGEDTEKVRVLLKYGAIVNAVDDRDYTPLHSAAESGQSDNCRLLLEHGAWPDVKDVEGRTPLDLARQSKDEATIKVLEAALSRTARGTAGETGP